MSEELYSVRNAAEILGLKSLGYTRKRLGKPDAVEKRKTGERFLYTMPHIQNLKGILAQERKDRGAVKGKISCYHCRRRCDRCQLRSGICPVCQAKKLILNFSCHGDCTKCRPDCEMLRLLDQTIHDFEEKIRSNRSSFLTA